MQNLVIATRNRHKTAELAAMLGPGWVVEDLTGRPELPEPEEGGLRKPAESTKRQPGIV